MLWGILFFIVSSLVIINKAQANWLTDIGTAIVGHANDLYDRTVEDDAFAPGFPVAEVKFRTDDFGQDAAHWVKGSASIVEYEGKQYIQLNQDFQAGLAPDLYIYVSESPMDIVDERSFNSTVQIELGQLTKGNGASFYEVPEGVIVQSITIWCKAFGQFMGSASVL